MLYGGLGNKAEGILSSVKSYYSYHLERLYVVDEEELEEYDIVSLEPRPFDEIGYATFPNKGSAETTLGKNGKKPNKHAK